MKIMTRDHSQSWSVEEETFEEYCHVQLHEGRGCRDRNCAMFDMTLWEISVRRVDLHAELIKQAGFEGWHGMDSKGPEQSDFLFALSEAVRDSKLGDLWC